MPVDFALTEEQIAAREMAHDFAEGELRRGALECGGALAVPAGLLARASEPGLIVNDHRARAVMKSRTISV